MLRTATVKTGQAPARPARAGDDTRQISLLNLPAIS
jgi:hypothetical protein